jgi:hypothetical protein
MVTRSMASGAAYVGLVVVLSLLPFSFGFPFHNSNGGMGKRSTQGGEGREASESHPPWCWGVRAQSRNSSQGKWQEG